MADFNKILDAGDVDGGVLNVVNEIGMGSILKVEWNRHLGIFELDRVEPGVFAKPCNYGFIPQTLDEDGDELDVLIVCDEALQTGISLKARIIGVMNFDDTGEMDHKVVVVPIDDRNAGREAIQSLDDLGERWMAMVEHHFTHYKDLDKPGSTKVLGWGNIDDAKAIVKESIERWKKEA
jgi:inorganic pyrophosphatase